MTKNDDNWMFEFIKKRITVEQETSPMGTVCRVKLKNNRRTFSVTDLGEFFLCVALMWAETFTRNDPELSEVSLAEFSRKHGLRVDLKNLRFIKNKKGHDLILEMTVKDKKDE